VTRTLAGRLGAWDGTHTGPLEAILVEGAPNAGQLEEAVGLATSEDPNLASGATWLVRRWAEGGSPPSGDVLIALVAALPEVTSPWARLHLCQAVRFLALPEGLAEEVVSFAEACRASERPFLRAWATDALVAVAAAHPRFEPAAGAALAAAFEDPAASVRARARQLAT
jgi:hypothetical protein